VPRRQARFHGTRILMQLEPINEGNELAGQLGQPAISTTKQEQIT